MRLIRLFLAVIFEEFIEESTSCLGPTRETGDPHRGIGKTLTVLPPSPPCDAAEVERAFGDKDGQLFERSEFLPVRQMPAQRRVPAKGGPGAGRLFLLTLFWRKKRVRRRAGTQPRGPESGLFL